MQAMRASSSASTGAASCCSRRRRTRSMACMSSLASSLARSPAIARDLSTTSATASSTLLR
ncbi:MAG: hypothetical protein ACLTMP_08425 [Eggerthella lenta]